jgi:hypothetical protein
MARTQAAPRLPTPRLIAGSRLFAEHSFDRAAFATLSRRDRRVVSQFEFWEGLTRLARASRPVLCLPKSKAGRGEGFRRRIWHGRQGNA